MFASLSPFNSLGVSAKMGLKRSFDEDLQELSFKHPKHLDSSEQLTSLAEISPSYRASQKADIPGEAVGIFCESLAPEVSKDDISNVVSDFNDTEFETSAPISWVTSSTGDEDTGSEAVLCSSDFPEHFEFNFPGSKLIQFEDAYSSLLNSSPKKEVPVGPDYQADVPVWDPEVIKKNSKSSTYGGGVDDNWEEMKGACVIPIADLDFSADVGKTKDGGPDCSCLDDGSVRCVKQHVKEAREKLKETIGHEKFVTLGFFDMGEEVAHKWTEEEEQVFHEVVYSNPASLGKNFWVQLSTMFPSRTKQELVSYYFNVFMLRRRTAQNRSSWLEIDSDDDEWMGNGGGPFGVIGEDEDSAAVSFINQGVRFDYGDDTQFEYSDDDSSSSSDESDDDSDTNDNGDVDGISQVGGVNAIENAEGKYHMSKGKIENTFDDCRFDLMDRSLGSIREFSDVQEDSCTSFEGHPFMMDSFCPIAERAAIKEIKVNRAKGEFLLKNSAGSSDKFGAEYALEPCEGKAWDAPYSMGLMKSVDLLPTCNMMEEIFGTCTWNSKSSNDKSIS